MKQTEEKIKEKEPHVNALIASLAKSGIKYEGWDEHDNVVFSYQGKVKKIRNLEFYRWSGICSYKRDIAGTTLFELVPMDDAMFYGSFLKTVIMYVFFPPKEKK